MSLNFFDIVQSPNMYLNLMSIRSKAISMELVMGFSLEPKNTRETNQFGTSAVVTNIGEVYI